MQRNCPSIYLAARNFSGLGRAGAAEKLHISESSLKCYEAGAKAPDEVALDMSAIYQAPWLRVQHLTNNVVFCDLFKLAMPEIRPTSNCVLSVQKELEDVKCCMSGIVNKAISGVRLGKEITTELQEAASALLSLFGREKEETAGAGTPTVSGISKI